MDTKRVFVYVLGDHRALEIKWKNDLAHLEFVQPKEPRLMVITLHGPTGPGVASHVEKEVNSVIASATTPRR